MLNFAPMERIELTNDEKDVFLNILKGNTTTPPTGMPYSKFYSCVFVLQSKGLINATFSCDKVVRTVVTDYGTVYSNLNPQLKNPINWSLISAVVTAVASAITAILTVYNIIT